MLQLSKNTVYELISRGEIVAKKIGKVYRIPANSISFVFTGLDYDLYTAEKEDFKELSRVEEELNEARKNLINMPFKIFVDTDVIVLLLISSNGAVFFYLIK